jgi:hypothetical protein
MELKNKNYTFDYNVGPHAKKIIFIIIWVMFGLNINIQSQKLHLKYSFDINKLIHAG